MRKRGEISWHNNNDLQAVIAPVNLSGGSAREVVPDMGPNASVAYLLIVANGLVLSGHTKATVTAVCGGIDLPTELEGTGRCSTCARSARTVHRGRQAEPPSQTSPSRD